MVSEKTALLSNEDGAPAINHSADASASSVTPSTSTNAEPTKEKPKWTRKQILTAVSLSLMNVSLTISFGIISPFYPAEAAKKGATPTVVGLVFGVFQLIMFLTAPIYGTYIQKIGAKYMFLSGAFILGGCSIAFGFLDKCPDGTIYVVMCFVCRSIEANGCSMLATASFAIMASTFPDNVGQAVGTLEIFSGLGMVLGPSIGGGLYGLGGYLLPFLVIGAIVWSATVISFFVLPNPDDVPRVTGSILSLLKIPGCIVVYIVIVCCGLGLSFLDPTFSPWMLKTFTHPQITVPQVGLIYMIIPGVHALCSPGWGYITDKGFVGSLSVAGLLITALSFILLGPSPLLQPIMPTTLPFVIMALIFMGFSIGAGLIPMFPLTLNIIRSRGFEDNLQTYGLVSGFFQSGFALGAFVGPTAAGYFAGLYGFAWSSSIAGFIIIAVALLMLAYILVMKSQGNWPPNVPESSSPGETSQTAASSESPAYGSIAA